MLISIILITMALSTNFRNSQATSENQVSWDKYYLIKISNAEADAKNPQVTIDSENNAHIVWEDYRFGYWPEICYTKLNRTGYKIVNDTRLSNISRFEHEWVVQYYAYSPLICIDSQNQPHFFWIEEVWTNTNHENKYNAYIRHAVINERGAITFLSDVYTQQNHTTFSTSEKLITGLNVAMDRKDNFHLVFLVSNNVRYYGLREFQYMKISVDNNILINKTTLTSFKKNETVSHFATGIPRIKILDNGQIFIVWAANPWFNNTSNSTEVFYCVINSNENKINFIINTTMIDRNACPDGPHGFVGAACDSSRNIHIVYPYHSPINKSYYSLEYLCLDKNGNIIVPKASFHFGWQSGVVIKIDKNNTLHLLSQTATDPLGGAAGIWYAKFNLTQTCPKQHYYWANIETRVPIETKKDMDLDGNGFAHIVWEGSGVRTQFKIGESIHYQYNHSIYYTTNAIEKPPEDVQLEPIDESEKNYHQDLFCPMISILIIIILIGLIYWNYRKKIGS